MEKLQNKKSWIIGGIVVILIIWMFGSYNGLVTSQENVDTNWAQIDNQLQRRYDLIPNLVSAVKGISKQEQTVFLGIAEARANYGGAKTAEEKAVAANQVEGQLSRLLLIAENYPALQSSKSFQDLMTSLEGTENRIGVARKDYNDSVNTINIKVSRFPTNIVAKIFGFSKRTYFEKSTGANEVPKVDFSN